MNKISSRSSISTSTARFTNLTKLIVAVAAVVALASLWAWWHYVYNAPSRVFWSMMSNNLSTASFSQTTAQDDGMQKLSQVTETNTSSQHLSNSRSVISQGDPVTTRVVTESIGTPKADYVRYADIQTTQKNTAGKDFDFSKIKNIWGMTPSSDTTSGQLYNQSVLSVLPFGDLSADKRSALLKQMQDSGAYTPQLASVTHSGLLGRPTYIFNVQVKPGAYIDSLKMYARATGLTQLESLDASQYQSSQPITVQVAVDGWSHQLTRITYGNSGRVESYSSFNSTKPLQTPPSEAVPVSELQSRLQSIQ